MINYKKIGIFLVLVFSIGWGPFLAASASVNEVSLESLGVLLVTMMYAPAISTFLVKKAIFREPAFSYGYSFKKFEYMIIGWLLPVVFALVSALLTVLFGFGKLDLAMTEFVKIFPSKDMPPYYVFFLSSLFLPVVLNCLFTIGEEVGWRGFLQDELRPLGKLKSYIVIGVIWGLWQIPLIIAGFNYAGQPFLGSVWIVIFSILASIFLGWVKDRSGSIWAPTIAHASFIGPAVTTLFFISSYNRLIGGIYGAIGFLVIGAFDAWLIASSELSG